MLKRLNRKKIDPKEPVYTGSNTLEAVTIDHFSYNKDFFEETCLLFPKEAPIPPQEPGKKVWINFTGIHDAPKVETIAAQLELHSLAIQDILDIHQRPKFQVYDDYWFFTLKSVIPNQEQGLFVEQISFILKEDLLVSFQEKRADHFEHIRQRLRQGLGVVRERTVDYLLYLLLEAILDNYFKTLSNFEAQIISTDIVNMPDLTPLELQKIENRKRTLLEIKKSILPIKEFTLSLEREKFNRIKKRHTKYFLEIKDLCLTLLDECDQLIAQLDSQANLFFSVQGHRMNEVMKTLTVVSTLFIPLTFLTGIYGMNFVNIPELNVKWGYYALWAVMTLTTLGLLYYFKRKKWF